MVQGYSLIENQRCPESNSINSDINNEKSFSRRWIVPFVHKYLPITVWLPKYTLSCLLSDFIAGITVGLMVVPQALAYASLAGLQNQYGLYSSFMGCFIYCVFGTAKDLTLGPTAILSLMVNIYGLPDDPEFTVTFTFCVGFVLLGMGILRLGFLVNFISVPVISAFTSAAAIVIAMSQLKDILGLHDIPRNFVLSIKAMVVKIGDVNPWDILYGVSCMIVLMLLRQLLKIEWREPEPDEKVPCCKVFLKKFTVLLGTGRNAVLLFVSIIIGYILVEKNDGNVLTLTDNIDFGLPPFEPPTFSFTRNNTHISFSDMLNQYGSGLIVVPLISFMEAIAIGKAFSRINNYKIIASQELIALGIANILSSFVSAYPITGSFSRTAVNSQSGVRTPAGGIFTGVLVILAIKFLTPAFQYIPRACLGAIIILAVLQMVDYKIVKKIWTVKRLDIIPLILTFLACFYSLEFGLLVGAGVSLVILLYPQLYPNIELDIKEITVLKVNNGISFSGIEHLSNQIESLMSSNEPPLMIMLDFSGVTSIDFTVVNELAAVFIETRSLGIEIYVTNLKVSVRQIFLHANLQEYIARNSHGVHERTPLI
eukprot:gene8999-9960_t